MNSVVIIFFLSGVITMIMVRTLRRDIAKYNRDDDEEDDVLEETGWKLVHGDVFRSPWNIGLFTALIGKNDGWNIVLMHHHLFLPSPLHSPAPPPQAAVFKFWACRFAT